MKSKILSRDQAAKSITGLKSRGQTVVFTNGCFDIIHAGHATYLAAAKKLGDILVVGLNRDSSVKRLKGPGRPIMPFRDRAILLSHLASVDIVVGFSEDTPARLIKFLKPDILVKGADYKIGEIVGASDVIGWGGKVRRIPLVKGKSSSKIIDKLLRGASNR